MRTGIIMLGLFLVLAQVSGERAAPSIKQQAPEHLPQPGLCLRMEGVRARDADTIEARVPGSAFVFALRLINTWAPETDSKDPNEKRIALEGKAFVQDRVEGERLLVFVPFDRSGEQPLKALSFDRVPAWVYSGDEEITINELDVREGFASSEKGGKRGE